MGWDRGRYYTRSRKINGRVVREYYGAGEEAELAAQVDAINRADREAERQARRPEKVGRRSRIGVLRPAAFTMSRLF